MYFSILFCLLLSHSYKAQNVGQGWDILSAKPKGLIFDESSSCLTVHPYLSNQKSLITEITERMDEYKSVDSKTISGKAGYFGLGGSYSKTYSDTKMRVNKEKLTYVRHQQLYILKNLLINKLTCKLNDGFLSSIELIGSYISKGNEDTAKYLLQDLMRNYGTHAVMSSFLGASLVMETYTQDSYYYSFSSTGKFTQVAVGFLYGSFSGAGVYASGATATEINTFRNYASYTNLYVKGGVYTAASGVAGWENSLLNDRNLVVIDVDGIAIDELMWPEFFPKIKESTLSKMRTLFKQNLEFYYQLNTHIGCMRKTYRSFDPIANVHRQQMCTDDILLQNEYYYGGAVLTNTNINPQLTNVLTNNWACNTGFSRFIIKFSNTDFLSFCASKNRPVKNAYFAGGYNTNLNDNFATGRKTCPSGYSARRLGSTANYICESATATPAVITNSVPFGGIIFQNKFEGLEETARSSCPQGFQRELLFFSVNNDPVYVCTVSKTFSVDLIEPPFMERPDELISTLTISKKTIIIISCVCSAVFLACIICLCYFCCKKTNNQVYDRNMTFQMKKW